MTTKGTAKQERTPPATLRHFEARLLEYRRHRANADRRLKKLQ